jgi:hypothetical protein
MESTDTWLDVPLGQLIATLRERTTEVTGPPCAAALVLALLEGSLVALNEMEPPKLRIPQHYTDPCPICGVHVRVWEEFLWTCPADRSPGEPGWQPVFATITEEMRKVAGVWSNCGEDYGLPCYVRVPMHVTCCDQ